jgi:cell shape-determining protein MreD
MRGRGRLAIIVLVVVLVVLHFLLRIGLGLRDLAPDFLVLALLLAARDMRAGAAAALGLVLGILEGAIVPFAMGALAVVFTALGYLGARTRELFASDSLILLAIYLFVGKWVADVLLHLLAGRLIHPAGPSTLLLISPLAALYMALAGILVTSVYRALT